MCFSMQERGITVVFQPLGKRSTLGPGMSLLDGARLCGVFVPSICGGRGKCGKCKVRVRDPSALEPPSQAETDLLGKQDLTRGIRLACMALPRRNLTVEIPEESRQAAPDILVEGLEYQITIDPTVTKHYVVLEPPTLDDPLADFERLRRALAKIGLDVEEESISSLVRGPDLMRAAEWRVTAAVWNSRRLIRVEPGDVTRRALGAAVDVGTTTIVCYLVDLLSGRTVSTDSVLNPQIPYGEDVVTRLAYARTGRENASRLHNLVASSVSRLISSCCRQQGVRTSDVFDVCIVGNTVMHHIALGLPTAYLGVSPFSPVVRRSLDLTAQVVGLKLNPDTPVHALPTLAGYVGADTCAVILASRIYEATETSMAIDIGTNGEIVLGDSSGLTVCSCAAGPALEGAHIRFGMRAAQGAIQRVKIEGDHVSLKTIGNTPPSGLAGAGIIDAVAAMRRDGALGEDGRFRDHPRVRQGDGMKEFVLARADQTGIGMDIVMTQRDIREVQLAKAAIHSGASTLMEYLDKDPEEISALYVAGAFGNFIDFTSAKIIGLIPDIPLDRLRFIGNGAAAGAKLALLSRSLREVSNHIAEKIRYVELTCATNFTKNYMDSTYLPHKDSWKFPSLRG